MAAFRAAFAAARPPPAARLLLSGPGVFAAEAAAGHPGATCSWSASAAALLLAAFLFWRFRSLALLALVAVPLLAATLAGYAATVRGLRHRCTPSRWASA